MNRGFIGAGMVIGLLVVIGAVSVGANLLREDEPEPGGGLRRPNAGQVRADYLPDGTPVWVIAHLDGSVDVLSAFDTHVPFHLGKLLWWCPTARGLDNPHHGSRWDEYGVRIGGPAPAGLSSWEVDVRSSRVFPGAPRPAPPRDAPVSGPPEHERDWCVPAEDQLVFHTFDGWKVWDSPTAAVEGAPEDWALLEGELVADRGEGRVRLCGLAGCVDSAVAANVELPPPGMDPRFGPLGGTRFIAHVRDGMLVDVTRVVFVQDFAP
ncbi:MAG TPA: hypothetical protein VEW95_12955 [Candidatus Limnocylindrales bacterium]|nr:hypothetical protein [Candidatus Limnocylindrales bacterium]